MTSDNQLLVDLRDALRSAHDVPASFLATGKAAFAWRNVDAELAALSEESAGTLAGARSEHAVLRAMTFSASSAALEIEMTEEALMGQVVPPQPGEIVLETRDRTRSTAQVDDLGWFSFRPVPETMFRLRLHAEDGTSVLTEWVTP